MRQDTESEFAPLGAYLRARLADQGFMGHVGAEVEELSPGICVMAVDRRQELLQQHGFFHGGVTAFLVDNATTVAAATVSGQGVLTAEFKLNLLAPAAGDRLICRARVVKSGRRVSVVAADVFCRVEGVEKHTATALASIAMVADNLMEKEPLRSPAGAA